MLKIAIIGAGTMGIGVAQVFAANGNYEIVLCSSNITSAERGKEKLTKQLMGRVAKGKITEEYAKSLLARICVGTLEDCSDCSMVLECVPEDMNRKRTLFTQLQTVCKDDCIFATNTSSLSITEMASGIRNPVIGMHFFNPAPVMKLVEVIPGLNTPEDVTEKVIAVAKDIGKVPVRVKESAGFVVNRMLIPMINEAIELCDTNVASVQDIDAAMKLGANHPMGPLALADYIGLDVCLAIMQVLYAETGDGKYRPSPLLVRMVRGGRLGRKCGQGFYKY